MSLAVAAASEGALPSRKGKRENVFPPKIQRANLMSKSTSCTQSGSGNAECRQIEQTGVHAAEAFSSVLVTEYADVASASATSALLV